MRIYSSVSHKQLFFVIAFFALVRCTEGMWSMWSDWSVCSVSCGTGMQMRVSICLGNNCPDPGRRQEQRDCGKPCKNGESGKEGVKIIWGPWSDWSICSVSCGKGEQTRIRICTDNKCQQPEREEQECGKPCPDRSKEREVGPWSPWSVCPVSCGKGQQMRVRLCLGNQCQEPEREQRECGEPCKGSRRGSPGPWSPWSACSVSCGKGQQMRVRRCFDNLCQEPEREQRECGKPCKESRIGRQNQKPEFSWQPWSTWGFCTVSCGSGFHSRIRTCKTKTGTKAPVGKCGKLVMERKFCNTKPCIIGGIASEEKKWPFQVLIITESRRGRRQQCGGTLISSSWILSAAHCFVDPFGNQWKIRRITLGTTDRRGIGQGAKNYSEVAVVHVHENFDKDTYLNDIALVKLPSPVDANDYIQSVKSPKENVKIEIGKSCTVMGWGATDAQGSKKSIPNDLQDVDVKIFSNEYCEEVHHTAGFDGSYTKSHFCAGHVEGKKDSCGGDSGGPLICKEEGDYVIRGITSSGPAECGKANKPGIYTRVSDFLTWIDRSMKGFRYRWTVWKRGPCSVTCGEGERTWTRQCLDKDNQPATECDGISSKILPCRRLPCVEYKWTSWESMCSVTCGEGIETSTRYCVDGNDAPTEPDKCKGEAEKKGKCVKPKCKEYKWTPWVSSCSVSCGIGIKTSTRTCVDADDNTPSKPENCPGNAEKFENCAKPNCIEYKWTAWESMCSVTCGEGIETSTRFCVDDNDAPTEPDKCKGEAEKKGKCVKPKCKEYKWTPWVSSCSVSCGIGIKTSTRTCVDADDNTPSKPENCRGNAEKVENCVKPNCIAYQWTAWESICSVTCGTGNGARVRRCVDNKGKNANTIKCVGDSVQFINCTEPPCVIKYRWGKWYKDSECSSSCGSGQIQMRRDCFDSNNSNIPDKGNCKPGRDTSFRPCNLKPCPVYSWSEWTTSCSVTCGSGVLTKKRNCEDENGNAAPDSSFCGSGSSTEKDVCKLLRCRPQKSYSWGAWSTWCSVTCGGSGTQVKSRQCLDSFGQVVPEYGKCSPGKHIEVGRCPNIPCRSIADDPPTTMFNWGPWGSWSSCRLRLRFGDVCNGFRSSTRDCLRGSEDVDPRMCKNNFPGEDYYRESTCKTNRCP